eukprot:1190608-Prorocentrum_minimum.AAC.4
MTWDTATRSEAHAFALLPRSSVAVSRTLRSTWSLLPVWRCGALAPLPGSSGRRVDGHTGRGSLALLQGSSPHVLEDAQLAGGLGRPVVEREAAGYPGPAALAVARLGDVRSVFQPVEEDILHEDGAGGLVHAELLPGRSLRGWLGRLGLGGALPNSGQSDAGSVAGIFP